MANLTTAQLISRVRRILDTVDEVTDRSVIVTVDVGVVVAELRTASILNEDARREEREWTARSVALLHAHGIEATNAGRWLSIDNTGR